MYGSLIPEINNDLKKTNKAIISLGCSFVQGHGAIDEHIYRNYKWEGSSVGHSVVHWKLNKEDEKRILQEYPELMIDVNGTINFSFHEHNNSFVNVLCKKYFNGEYTPINLGRSGNGNRATIKELYFYPDINWDDIKETIVIYCPTGGERVDFMDDMHFKPNDHPGWVTAWPNTADDGKGARNKLWSGIKESLNSVKFQILEQIAHVQELMLWCKYKNAKLIVVPAFMQHFYSREFFLKEINRVVFRKDVEGLQKITDSNEYDKSLEKVVDMWPWSNMFSPDNTPSFADYCLQQEFGSWQAAPYFYTYLGKGSPDLWISPCCHPSKKSHDAFAKVLHKHIMEKL